MVRSLVGLIALGNAVVATKMPPSGPVLCTETDVRVPRPDTFRTILIVTMTKITISVSITTSYLLSSYHVPGTVPRALHDLIHLILSMIQWGGYY